MKTLFFLACLLPATVLAAKDKPRAVQVRNTHSNVFYFKVNPELWGAEIEVRNEKNEVILTHHLSRRKALIDFFYELPGTYTINFVKGDCCEQFSFVKAEEFQVENSEEGKPTISITEWTH